MKRVLCAWLPRWPVQRFRRARPALSNRPLVLYAPGPRGPVVAACSPAAERAGAVPGLPLAEARALGAGAHFAPHEPRADRAALQALAGWAQRFSPIVALEEAGEPECLLLDVTGCSPRFGGEAALAAELVAGLRRAGCWARAAVADTAGAAWAVAHHAAGPSAPAVVPPAGQAEALRPLPVEALRLPGDVVALLHQFDVRRVGQLLALPRAALPARFGPTVLLRIDQALGRAAEPLTPEPAAEPLEAAWEFEPPAGDRRAVEAIVERLLEQLLDRLRPRQIGVRRLAATLRMAGGGSVPLAVGLLRPSDSVPHVMELVRLHCERLRLPAEVAAVVVRAEEVAPLEFCQGRFAEGEADRWRHLPALVERLSSRLGEGAVLCPRLCPDAQPEHAGRFEPWLTQNAAQPPSAAARGELPPRPPYLKPRPVAVAAVSVVPEGPPLRLEWEGAAHTVACAWGPERVETGWWRECDVRRDYYLVETTAGRRFWLFRALEDGRWFLHGAFA